MLSYVVEFSLGKYLLKMCYVGVRRRYYVFLYVYFNEGTFVVLLATHSTQKHIYIINLYGS